MKTVIIDSNSWHYKFVNYFHQNSVADNICGYMRQFLGSVFVSSLLVVLITCVSAMFGDLFAWLLWLGINKEWVLPGVMAGIAATITIFGVGILIFAWASDNHERIIPPIIHDGWESFHEKVCFKVETK
jgi:hypothetical protein